MKKEINMLDKRWHVNSNSKQYILDGFQYYNTEPLGTRLLIQGLGCEARVIWKEVVNEFSEFDSHYNLIAFDVRGIGKSDGKPISLEQIVQDTVQVILKEKKKIQLIGHSLGGIVALKVAEKIPEYVSNIILVCSNPSYTPKSRSGFAWRAGLIQKTL